MDSHSFAFGNIVNMVLGYRLWHLEIHIQHEHPLNFQILKDIVILIEQYSV